MPCFFCVNSNFLRQTTRYQRRKGSGKRDGAW